jgi:hypothetical protein
VALCAINKGYSSNFILNEEVLKIHKQTVNLQGALKLVYIYTKDNPADPLSRNEQKNERHERVLKRIRTEYDQGSQGVGGEKILFPNSSVPILSLKDVFE